MSTTVAGGDRHAPRPLPIRPRPTTGESVASYVRRMARANHLRPTYLRRYLRTPDQDGAIRLDWLAILAGRPLESLQHAFADPEQYPGSSPRHPPTRSTRRAANKAAVFATIRRDAHGSDRSIRALADRHGVHRRTVLQALASPVPPPRKRMPPRTSRLDPFKDTIDTMLQTDQDAHRRTRRTVKSLYDTLVTEHGMTGVSYSTLRDYITNHRFARTVPRTATTDTVTTPLPTSSRRNTPAMTSTPAHQAVELEDLPRLRDLLNAGHDVEDDNGVGWTLLRHAIDVEHDGHVQTGEPLHADVTAFLLARGADPQRPGPDGIPAVVEAEIRGHWLAAEIMRAWIKQR